MCAVLSTGMNITHMGLGKCPTSWIGLRSTRFLIQLTNTLTIFMLCSIGIGADSQNRTEDLPLTVGRCISACILACVACKEHICSFVFLMRRNHVQHPFAGMFLSCGKA